MATVDGKGRTFWTPLVDEFERTDGITQAAFARQYGIKAGTFRKWLYQLRAERKATQDTPPVRFVEVDTAAAPARPTAVLEMGALRLELEALPEPAWLAELTRALGGESC
jgi:transposase-like protein